MLLSHLTNFGDHYEWIYLPVSFQLSSRDFPAGKQIQIQRPRMHSVKPGLILGLAHPPWCLKSSTESPNGAISDKAGKLIFASWQDKTNANSWRKWEEWCEPFTGLLADQFEAGRKCHSLNCYKSAVSSCHLPIDGFLVCQYPLVFRCLKGAINLHPSQPKYSST